jgi:HPt (histidine-containing phosphotransfer) domain-containing protein
LTADALSSERQRAAWFGMDDYIVKPFDAQALVGSVLRHVKTGKGSYARQTDKAPQTPAPADLAWPEIDGIDSSDVRERLSNDFVLFQSMLKRLLDEFSDVAIPAMARDPVALALYMGRMHKLKGSAGVLGAKTIQQLAGEAETACVAGEVERAGHFATKLSAQLRRLRQSAAPTLMARAQAEKTARPSGGDLEPRALAELVDLLRQQSLSAMQRFTSISPQLRGVLGKDSYELVRAHIDNLRFSDAANALEASRR